MRRVAELHWPSLLAGSACAGLSASNWLSLDLRLALLVAVTATAVMALSNGSSRLVTLALVLAAGSWAWGSLRMEALERSVLSAEVGTSGRVELVTTAPARTSSWTTRVIGVTRSFRDSSVKERVLLTLPVGRSPPRGAVIDAVVRVVEPRTSDDGFDERTWLARQGIHVVLRASEWRVVGRRGGVGGLGDRVRDRVERAVGRGVSGVRRGLVLGVVLGEDEGLPARVRNDFRASGLYHLLAVSGQNVAFIAGGIYALGWLLRLSRVAREIVSLVAIACYVLAVGWQPSVARAGIAGGLASLAWLAARPRDRWHFLALGALVLLAWMPTTVLDPGFQLSFAAVAAIFVGVPRARRVVDGTPVPPVVAEAVSVALVCGLVTAPIVLVHFDRAPLYTVPANVLAFPAAPAVLGLGLLAAVVDPVSPAAAAGLAWLAGWAAAWLELVARVVAALPAAQLDARAAVAGVAGLVALALTARSARRRHPTLLSRRVLIGGASLALVAAAAWWAIRPGPAWTQPAGLRVTFLDVGQGDSVLLETASARVLVDEGPPEAHVAQQLTAMGIHSLSALVLTHPQRDHVGGAADVVRRLWVGEILDPGLAASGPEREEAVAVARERGVPVRVVRTGSTYRAGGLLLHVLWPPDPGSPGEDPNQNAVVLTASFGETDVFLSADAESDVTARLPLRAVEIMKVAHHGSADPGLEDELRTLRPRIAVISCGRHNDHGHPRPETLAALAEIPGLAVYRTDLDGRVVVESDGRRLGVRTTG